MHRIAIAINHWLNTGECLETSHIVPPEHHNHTFDTEERAFCGVLCKEGEDSWVVWCWKQYYLDRCERLLFKPCETCLERAELYDLKDL